MAATLNVVLGSSWTLVYDAAVSGDFTGAVGTLGSGDVQVLATTGGAAPLATDQGVVLPESYGFTPVALSKDYGDRLYAKLTTGSASLQMAKRFGAAGLPAGVFEGLRAMTIQDYVEANVKNGTQFEMGSDAPIPLAATGQPGDTTKLIFKTGSKRILVKARIIGFTGAGVLATVHENAEYTGGTPVPTYNLRRIGTPPTSTVTVLSGATVTNDGTLGGAPNVSLGSTSQGQTVQGSFAVKGLERQLEANTTYMLSIKNLDTAACKVAAYVTWFEGGSDLPIVQ